MTRSIVLVLAVCAVATVAAPGAAVADEPCHRYAATPQRVFHGDDFEYVHTAASAMYCPDNVYVQITACVQVQTAAGWDDVGCRTSPGTYVTSHTQGGRGQALTFDVPCVSGSLRTHVTGGEGLEPSEWDSGTGTIACSAVGPGDTTPPQTFIVSGPSGVTDSSSPSFAFASSEAGSSFECLLDDGEWATCSSPVSYASLSDGEHVFQVRASDAAGNTDASPATRSFRIDTSEPPPNDPAPTPSPGLGAPAGPHGGARDTTPPVVVVPRKNRRIRATRAGAVRFSIGPILENASGVLSLRTGGTVLGQRSFSVLAGRTVTVRIRLLKKDRTMLRRQRRLHIHAVIILRDAAGNAATAAYRFTLRVHR